VMRQRRPGIRSGIASIYTNATEAVPVCLFGNADLHGSDLNFFTIY
jgi:hypothetical protein